MNRGGEYCSKAFEKKIVKLVTFEKDTPAQCNIPFQIDTPSVEEDKNSCLKVGVYIVNDDDIAPTLSVEFTCAKWSLGRTRCNPSSVKTYEREY